MKKTIALILAGLLLSGCSSQPIKKDNLEVTAIDGSTDKNSTSSKGPDENTIDNIPAKDISSKINNHKQSDEVQPDYKKYTDTLGIAGKVSKLIKEDIDLDGKQEIIMLVELSGVGLGAFVLREDGSKFQKLGELDGYGYCIDDLELVKLQGKKQKYIKIGVTNGANLSGFALYEVGKSNIGKIVYSASATGAGEDYLLDSNKDGFYDGYVQHRCSYDVLYFDLSRFYKWNDGNFSLDLTSLNSGNYPDNPEEVVSRFLRLNILNTHEEKCTDISKKIKELNTSSKRIKFAKVDEWNEAFESIGPEIDSKINGDTASVAVELKNEKIAFSLTKVNGKWIITNMGGANIVCSEND